MLQKYPVLFLLLAALGWLLVACASSGDPAKTVEKYLQAKVNRDADTVASLLCGEMEGDLELEAHTFDTVTGVTIEDMACKGDDGSDTVTCQGVIVASYGAENVRFPLGKYRVVEEDGEWKWCGEAG